MSSTAAHNCIGNPCIICFPKFDFSHTTCNCHQCTWLRANQFERMHLQYEPAVQPNTPLEEKKENIKHICPECRAIHEVLNIDGSQPSAPTDDLEEEIRKIWVGCCMEEGIKRLLVLARKTK